MARNKIIWAFNPFQKNRKVFKNTVNLLKSWGRTGHYRVEPVFVVSPAEAKVVLEFSVPARIRFQTVAKRAVLRALRGVRFKGLLPPTILVENHLAVRFSAKTLAEYAAGQKAHKIVVGTQAREGIDRFLLGSFAETLLFYSKVPVLLINPHITRVEPPRKILFATDFSRDSLTSFHKIVATAERHGSKILLYHCLPRPFRWAKQAAEFLFGRGMMSVSEYLAIESENRGRAAAPFLRYASAHGVPTELKIHQSDQEAGDSILAAAKESKANLIAMVAHTHKVTTILLGSTTRGVIREAKTPVWILRPR